MNPSQHSNDLAAALSPEVLALLAASYGKPADRSSPNGSTSSGQVVAQATRHAKPKSEKPSKLAAVKQAKAAEETHPVTEVKPPMVAIELPKLGTYDARSFLLTIRKASNRNEQIQAIAGYCGFDRYGEFGAQELAARMQAQREIRGVKALPKPVHTAAATLAGWVTGLPNAVESKRNDLLGREALAAEAIAEHETAAREHLDRGDVASAHYEAQLALVEKGRLAQIQNDLKEMGTF